MNLPVGTVVEVLPGTHELLGGIYILVEDVAGQTVGPIRVSPDEVALRKDIPAPESDSLEPRPMCSEGHPMVIRLGRDGRFLSCSPHPDNKESRPIQGSTVDGEDPR